MKNFQKAILSLSYYDNFIIQVCGNFVFLLSYFLSLKPVQNLEFISGKEVGKFEDLRIKNAS